ncbi:MAG: peptidyl-tRNA hydrolase Pth2 [Candidatus Bathyarchaeota archaeon]|nr:peptidyl-tRNA hydrolase Pth2 [Candidatus Bathyarchaeota archaeon]
MGNFDYKQVVVVRADLKMSIGKTAVQASHAAVSAAEQTRKERSKWWREWMNEGQRKIIVKVDSEETLLEIKREAEALGVPNALVKDMGLTELEPGTMTALGIGPALSEIMDRITGKLPLL